MQEFLTGFNEAVTLGLWKEWGLSLDVHRDSVAYGTGAGIGYAVDTLVLTEVNWVKYAKASPWLGSVGIHPPHHGMGRHLEIILRVGKDKVFKFIAPGKGKPFFWRIQ